MFGDIDKIEFPSISGNPETIGDLHLKSPRNPSNSYTQIKIKAAYKTKLSQLAEIQNRSMANVVEVLIDQALKEHHR